MPNEGSIFQHAPGMKFLFACQTNVGLGCFFPPVRRVPVLKHCPFNCICAEVVIFGGVVHYWSFDGLDTEPCIGGTRLMTGDDEYPSPGEYSGSVGNEFRSSVRCQLFQDPTSHECAT